MAIERREGTFGEAHRFTPEARRQLKKAGYHTYCLTGQSISVLRKEGRPLSTVWYKNDPEVEMDVSRRLEVAINPNKLLLTKSNRNTPLTQDRMVEEFSKELAKNIGQVGAVIGGVADYADLSFLHLDETGERLFGERHHFSYVRTVTQTKDSSFIFIGNFSIHDGLDIDHWGRGVGDLWIAPLVVPR